MSGYVAPKRQPPYSAILAPTPPKEPDMTAADIRRYVAELPDTVLFGAVKRFRDEAVLDRDRLPVTIVKAADGVTDFWTGDVTTGGANGYFVRAYISEYLIARDAGQRPLDASVAGFVAAAKSYAQAVAPPPAPVQPGTLRGPITTSGREFEVPE